MDNNLFQQGLSKVFGAIGNAAHDVGGVLDGLLNGSKMQYVKADTQQPKDTFNPQVMMAAVRSNETGGQKNPYAYSRYSGSATQGRALGAYQVTEGELKTYGQKFLGKPITSDQFLANPKLQDNYMIAKFEHGQKDLGLTPQQLLATHRGGYTNPESAMVKYKGYVNNGMKYYNSNI